jgi:hypothetical protein
MTGSVSSRYCWSAVAAAATVDVGRALIAHVTGIARCGSPWACPLCAPVVRERRAQEIDRGLRAHLESGGGAEFVTMTVRHSRRDDLAGRLAVVSQALRWCLHGRPWERRRAALGYLGAIRSIEVTWGESNGWHPHLHAVLCFAKPLTAGERADLAEWLYGRWSGVCEARGLGTVTRARGVDVRPVTAAGGLSEYLTKLDGGWSAGLELARSDVKKSAGRFTPMQLLAELAETGDVQMRSLWIEYEEATRGKRAIVWSPGLRARLLAGEAEVSDEDLAASEGIDLALLRATVPAAAWNELVRTGAHALVLDDIENTAGWLLTLCEVLGHEVAPIGDTG